MRFDTLTTKFQQAFADAQSLALPNHSTYTDAPHLLLAPLADREGRGPRTL